ncbi:hypothetical protein E2C01_031400 [Portunus trituberculatus]|uniref:Uncharacterized protein n=1 Tax=Portunus trituberculatus TaxID=210409 RepID=A0A5B7EWQ3_PORTR|nr:hypothetical protein [Portunus trituberculatus]
MYYKDFRISGGYHTNTAGNRRTVPSATLLRLMLYLLPWQSNEWGGGPTQHPVVAQGCAGCGTIKCAVILIFTMLIVQGDHINSQGPHLPWDTFCGKGPSATLPLVEF